MSEDFINKLFCAALHIDKNLRYAKLYKVFAIKTNSILLKFRKDGGNIFLRLSADPTLPHFLLQKENTADKFKIPATFTVVLRKNLTGLCLDNVKYHPRALELTFSGNGKCFLLLLKLSANFANIYLLDNERKVVADIFCRNSKLKTLDNIEEYTGQYIENSDAISEEIDALYLAAKEEKNQEILIKELAKKRKRLERLINNLEKDKNKLEKSQHYRGFGELAKCNFHLMKRGLSELTVPDLFSDSPDETSVTIPLNPAKSPQENVEILFTKSKKFERGIGKVDERLQVAREELATLCENAVSTKELRPVKKKHDKKMDFRHFISHDGISILVGRSSRENDRLTMVTAKGNDLWLHAVNYPGSHVIIKLSGNEIPQETLIDAAALAIFYSKAKRQGEGEVVYTRRKNVRKPKKAKPGAVIPSQGRYIYIKQEQERIDRLFSSKRK